MFLLSYLSLRVSPGGTKWELLVQRIRSGSVQCAQTNCEGHRFNPTECAASAGETASAPGRQAAQQRLPQQPACLSTRQGYII